MSLYEVSDIKPGQSLMARDLLRDGDPVLVHEGTTTRTLEDMAWQADGLALFNGDEEDQVFHDVYFPLTKGVTQKTVECKCCFKIPHMCCRKIPQHGYGDQPLR
ncbi:hypothetical protein KRIGEM_02941 (plasmid) [Komagataeibacter rhaeticus]|nr:hypothetical protein [Komagataeibacter rhaeticus]SAY49952.1 hypothetical protein KRIGEM_02941 [Komagataeibacter rhaeticus]